MNDREKLLRVNDRILKLKEFILKRKILVMPYLKKIQSFHKIHHFYLRQIKKRFRFIKIHPKCFLKSTYLEDVESMAEKLRDVTILREKFWGRLDLLSIKDHKLKDLKFQKVTLQAKILLASSSFESSYNFYDFF